MGWGYGFKCSKCKREYSYGVGVGFMFPEVYENLMKEVKKGKYGEEWKDLALKTKHVAIDAEEYLYCCSKCGNWKTEEGLSLYEPKDIEQLKKYEQQGKGRWAVGLDFKDASYVTTEDLREYYKILKKYIHRCEKCGTRMHRANMEESLNLKCPKCGGKPLKDHVCPIRWD
ncbi:MAG: hypothetical protein K6G75_03985 [Lachnospiraceae bacterium]|nr:hypothetical protein [Lachnospiraceae bacterium]